MNAESRSSDKHVLWVQIHTVASLFYLTTSPKSYPHTRSILPDDLTVLKIIKSVAG